MHPATSSLIPGVESVRDERERGPPPSIREPRIAAVAEPDVRDSRAGRRRARHERARFGRAKTNFRDANRAVAAPFGDARDDAVDVHREPSPDDATTLAGLYSLRARLRAHGHGDSRNVPSSVRAFEVRSSSFASSLFLVVVAFPGDPLAAVRIEHLEHGLHPSRLHGPLRRLRALRRVRMRVRMRVFAVGAFVRSGVRGVRSGVRRGVGVSVRLAPRLLRVVLCALRLRSRVLERSRRLREVRLEFLRALADARVVRVRLDAPRAFAGEVGARVVELGGVHERGEGWDEELAHVRRLRPDVALRALAPVPALVPVEPRRDAPVAEAVPAGERADLVRPAEGARLEADAARERLPGRDRGGARGGRRGVAGRGSDAR